ncbi:derlin-1-like [Tropilaelaps mercedesae]|uniref:Derlin n=1 Tax=Tropilaelaps mercedesae TaxID=418985 RepID=A0A1V9XUY6_9ACAR|nr:derlin-1-like [Tropilaelaps mercedesae]
MGEIADWFRSLPLLTRYWFGMSIVFPVLGRFKIISPYHLIFIYHNVFKQFQIWRPFTAVFFYPVGFHYLVNLYFLYSYSVRLETSAYSGRPAEYLFMLLFNFVCILVVAIFSEIQLLMDPMVLSVLYVWCQLNKDQIVPFWFGTRFKAIYLPWVLFAFNMVISGGGLYELIGILVGHFYFFLNFQYPQEGGRQLLHVPNILYKYFPNQHGGFGGFGQAPQRRDAARGDQGDGQARSWFSSHNWGTGHVLGRQ